MVPFAQMMELELRKLEENIRSIHEEMYYLRERYAVLQSTPVKHPEYSFFLFVLRIYHISLIIRCLLFFQGRRNAGTEQENKLKDGLAWFPLAHHLPISGGLAVMAPEEFL